MREIDQRLEKFCRDQGVGGVICRRRSNCAWITGGADFHVVNASDLGVATCLWTPDAKTIYTDNIEAPRLRDEEPIDGWTIAETPWWESQSSLESQARSGRFMTDWPHDPLHECRASLTEAQAADARELGRETAAIVGRIMREDVKPGMTEWHLGGALAGWLRDAGISATVVLVASDERIARYRHPIPTRKPIERVAMAAICAQRRGLIVSVTRLVHFGPVPDDLERRHRAVNTVADALHGATRVGSRWCDALDAGIRAYGATGFADEWKLHHQGGPMGYCERDFKATPAEQRRVVEHQLVGWNPTITGTKSEQTILTRAGGVEVLTADPDWPTLEGQPDILRR